MDAASSGSYVITLTASITGTANLRALNLASGMGVTLEGGGFTLSGNSLYRGLFVYAGTVTVQHLTIQDAVAQGGKGAGGGGAGLGGAGLGGGLFMGGAVAGTAVTLDGVTFTHDSAAGNGSEISGNFLNPAGVLTLIIDSIAPAAPGSLALAVPSDSGVAGDGVTNHTTPEIIGTAEAGSIVTLTDTRGSVSTVLGTALTDNTGHWSFTPGTPLAEGGHSVTTTARDASGNVSAPSAAMPLTIDSGTPAAPGNLALAVPSDSNVIGDGITNQATPVIIGTAEAGSTVTLTSRMGALPACLATPSPTTPGTGPSRREPRWPRARTPSPPPPGTPAATCRPCRRRCRC